MSKISYLCLLGFMALLAGCSSDEGAEYSNKEPLPQPGSEINLSPEGRGMVQKSNDFVFDLLTRITSEEQTNHKICFSPLGTLNTLSLAANGASEETSGIILRILGLNGTAQTELDILNTTFRELLGKLPIADPKVNFNFSNSLWVAPHLTPGSDFSKILMESYYGEVISVDPSGQTGMQEMNRWVKEKTNGLIESMLSFPQDSKIGLFNTVYFKGEWTSRFSPYDTFRGAFKNQDGTSSSVKFMKGHVDGWEASSDGFEMVTIPFGNRRFVMSFIMTENDQYPSPDSQILTAASWESLLQAEGDLHNIDLTLPKFDFDYDIDLYNAIDTMHPGLLANANYDRLIVSGKDVPFNQMLQKTKIQIDENGAQAASATWVGGILAPCPKVFNRPFYFVIHEKTTGAILFLGHISAF